MGQEESSDNIGQESGEDDCERRVDVGCGKVEGLVYLHLLWGLVLRKFNFTSIWER